MLGRTPTVSKRKFNNKLNAGRRWLELVTEIGWVIALFGDQMKLTWFTEISKSDWAEIRDVVVRKRHQIRETAKEILRTDFEWMMTPPICISF